MSRNPGGPQPRPAFLRALSMANDNRLCGSIRAALSSRVPQLSSKLPSCDALLVSDYGYGVITPEFVSRIRRMVSQPPSTPASRSTVSRA